MTGRRFVVTKAVSLGNVIYRAWDSWKEGEYVVGKFVKFHRDERYDKTDLILLVEEASWDSTLKGKKLNLKENAMLAKYYKEIEEASKDSGVFVQIIYNGKSVMEKGKYKGKEAHSLDIQIVEDSMGVEDDL